MKPRKYTFELLAMIVDGMGQLWPDLLNILEAEVVHLRDGRAKRLEFTWVNTEDSPSSADVSILVTDIVNHSTPPNGYGVTVRGFDLGKCGVMVGIYPLVRGVHI